MALLTAIIIAVAMTFGYCKYTVYTARSQDPSLLKWGQANPEVLSDRLSNNELCSIIAIAGNASTSISPKDLKFYKKLATCKKATKNYWKAISYSNGCTIAGIGFSCFDKTQQPYDGMSMNPSPTVSQCGLTLADRLPFFTSQWLGLKSPNTKRVPYSISTKQTISYLGIKKVSFFGDIFLRQIANAFQYSDIDRQDEKTKSLMIHHSIHIPCGLTPASITKVLKHDYYISNMSAYFHPQFAYCRRHHHTYGYPLLNISRLQPKQLFIMNPMSVATSEDRHFLPRLAKSMIELGKQARDNHGHLLLLEAGAEHYPKDHEIVAERKQRFHHMNQSIEVSPSTLELRAQLAQRGIPNSCCHYAPQHRNLNHAFRKFLDQEDPLWESYIGWIYFYHISDQASRHHVDNGHDCTYFSYSTLFFDPIWQNIESELLRLNENRLSA